MQIDQEKQDDSETVSPEYALLLTACVEEDRGLTPKAKAFVLELAAGASAAKQSIAEVRESDR